MEDIISLKAALRYSPEAKPSCLIWSNPIGLKVKPGDVAGYSDGKYASVRYKGKLYRAHRVVWLILKGYLPAHIDHIDGNGLNNEIGNLRECLNGQKDNQQNNARKSNNKSGFLGVSWSKQNKKWQAQITANYVHRHLGFYETPEEAYEIYKKAKRELHSFNPIPREEHVNL